MPQWQKEIQKVKDVPFLFLHLKGAAHDELRDIASLLQSKSPGIYMLISSEDNRSMFFVSVADQFADRVNLKKFGSYLKDELGLRGGGARGTLQGGGGKFDPTWKEAVIAYLAK